MEVEVIFLSLFLFVYLDKTYFLAVSVDKVAANFFETEISVKILVDSEGGGSTSGQDGDINLGRILQLIVFDDVPDIIVADHISAVNVVGEVISEFVPYLSSGMEDGYPI